MKHISGVMKNGAHMCLGEMWPHLLEMIASMDSANSCTCFFHVLLPLTKANDRPVIDYWNIQYVHIGVLYMCNFYIVHYIILL